MQLSSRTFLVDQDYLVGRFTWCMKMCQTFRQDDWTPRAATGFADYHCSSYGWLKT